MQNDIKLEQAVIGGIITGIESNLSDSIFIELTEDNFSSPITRILFSTLQVMAMEKKPIDHLTLQAELEVKGLTQKVTPQNIVEVVAEVTTGAHLKAYVGLIKRNTYLRKIRKEIQDMNPEASAEDIERIMCLVQMRDSTEKKTTVTPGEFMPQYITDLKTKVYKGIDTGFRSIDKFIHPQGGDVVVVGARTNVGKTTCLTNIMVDMLKREIKCLYCPTEMRPIQFMDRISPLLVSIPAEKFRSRQFDGEDMVKIDTVCEQALGLPLTLLNIASPTIYEVASAVKSSGCKVLFLDYLGRCSMSRETTRMREIEKFMVELKNLCVEKDILCFLAVQLSRATDFNKDSSPRLADLSDSSAIEKEADAVIFLWKNPEKNTNNIDYPVISALIAKNRHGPVRSFDINFNSKQTAMMEVGYEPKPMWNEPKNESPQMY